MLRAWPGTCHCWWPLPSLTKAAAHPPPANWNPERVAVPAQGADVLSEPGHPLSKVQSLRTLPGASPLTPQSPLPIFERTLQGGGEEMRVSWGGGSYPATGPYRTLPSQPKEGFWSSPFVFSTWGPTG